MEINIFCVVLNILMVFQSKGAMQIASHSAFKRSVASVIIFILSDAFAYMMVEDAIPFSPIVLLILKSLYFISTSLMCCFWFLYYECLQNSDIGINERKHLWIYIPLSIQIILTLINLKTGYFFYFDGKYERGSLFVIQYVFAYSYVIAAAVRTLKKAFSEKNYVDKENILNLLLIMLLPSASGIVQFFYPKMPLACCAMTISSQILYFTALRNMISADPLTGLSNRRELMIDISKRMKQDTEGFWILMIDADLFKSINDNYGHVEGDNALKNIAKSMKKACLDLKIKATCGRYGGDEFTICANTDDVDLLCKKIKENLAVFSKDSPYTLSVSIGKYKYNPQVKTVRQLISLADEELYKIKKSR